MIIDYNSTIDIMTSVEPTNGISNGKSHDVLSSLCDNYVVPGVIPIIIVAVFILMLIIISVLVFVIVQRRKKKHSITLSEGMWSY